VSFKKYEHFLIELIVLIQLNFNKLKLYKIKSLSYYLIASLLTTAIGLIINPFLSLGLSHVDFAIIGYFASFGGILSPIIVFSFNNYYARNYFLVDDYRREKILQTILSLFFVCGLVVFGVFFTGYYLYHKKFVLSIPFSPYALLSFFPMYFSSFYNIYLLDLRMKNKAKRYAFITILNSIIGAILSILLVYVLEYGAEGRLVASLIVAMLFGIYSLRMEKFRFGIDNIIAKEAFSFCWPLTISAILSFFFIGIDRTFLVNLNDNYNMGLYNIALQISGYLGIFGSILLQTFDPDLYRYTSLNQHKKVFYLAVLIIGMSIIPNLLFIVFSKPLISFLTYGKYTEAASFSNILCLRNIATTFAFIISGILIGYGYTRYELINRIFGSLLAFLIYKYFIETWGFYGAAWGQSLSWIAMGLISLICLLILKNKKNAKA
jgi:O-antigen/teichoic acid export membrane protein